MFEDQNKPEKVSFFVETIFPVNRCWDLFTELGINDFEELNDQDRVHLFRSSQVESWGTETIIKNKAHGRDYYVVAIGQAELRVRLPDDKIIKKKLGPGAHYINQSGVNKKLVAFPGCTLLRIPAKILLQEVTLMIEMAYRLRLLKRCLPTNRIDVRNLKDLAKKSVEVIYVHGRQLIPCDQHRVYFILQGSCELNQQNSVVSTVNRCMFGEQILFKRDYDYSVKILSATAKIFSIDKEEIIQQLSPSTIDRIQAQYRSRVNARSQSFEMKVISTKKSQEEFKKSYQNNISLLLSSGEHPKVDLQDSELKKTFSYCATYRKRQLSNHKQNPQTDDMSKTLTNRSTDFNSFCYRTSSTPKPKLKFRSTYQDSHMKTEGNTVSLKSTNRTNRHLKTEPTQQWGYRFAGIVKENFTDETKKYISNSPIKRNNFMNDYDQKIIKRLKILSGVRVDCIYEDLEKSRQDKEKALKGIIAKGKQRIDVKQLFRKLVKNSPRRSPKRRD